MCKMKTSEFKSKFVVFSIIYGCYSIMLCIYYIIKMKAQINDDEEDTNLRIIFDLCFSIGMLICLILLLIGSVKVVIK